MGKLFTLIGMFLFLAIGASGQTAQHDSTRTGSTDSRVNTPSKDKPIVNPYTNPERTQQPQPREVRQGDIKQKPALRNNTPAFDAAPTEKAPNNHGCGYLEAIPPKSIGRVSSTYC